MRKKYSEKLVVLIDEYNDPVSKSSDNTTVVTSERGEYKTITKANQDVLTKFYSGLKSVNSSIYLAVVTGVSHYSMMGISAGLNHLIDITYDPKYATICGFSPEEVRNKFSALYPRLLEEAVSIGHIPQGATEDDLHNLILEWYDGYSWDGIKQGPKPMVRFEAFRKTLFRQLLATAQR